MKKTNFEKIMEIAFRKKVVIISIMLISIIIGSIYTILGVDKAYESSTTFVLGLQTTISDETISGDNIAPLARTSIKLDSQTISTYNEIIKSNTIIKKIKDNLKINMNDEELKESITVVRVNKSDLVKITVQHTDKEMAKKIVDEIVKEFSEKAKEIYQSSEIYTIDAATSAEIPYNVHPVRDILFFIVCAIFISYIYCLSILIFDKTIRNSETVEELGLQTLVSIPNKKTKKQLLEKLINFEEKKSPILEAFQILRKNVQFTNVYNKNNKVILVTSCVSTEGKSYVAANLAAMFAQIGKKVIVIDADMRVGSQANIFEIPNQLGISNYLANLDMNGMEINERINSYIKETSVKNLNVITSGSVPPNCSELLSSERLPELIKDLSVFYDCIIVDGAPVLPVTDSLILAKLANSTILVSLANKTKKERLKKAKTDLQYEGARITGVVLNQASSYNKVAQKAYSKLELKKAREKEQNAEQKINIKNMVLKIKEWLLKHLKKKESQLLLEQKQENAGKIEEIQFNEQEDDKHVKQKMLENDERYLEQEVLEEDEELLEEIIEDNDEKLESFMKKNREVDYDKILKNNNYFEDEKITKRNNKFVEQKKQKENKKIVEEKMFEKAGELIEEKNFEKTSKLSEEKMSEKAVKLETEKKLDESIEFVEESINFVEEKNAEKSSKILEEKDIQSVDEKIREGSSNLVERRIVEEPKYQQPKANLNLEKVSIIGKEIYSKAKSSIKKMNTTVKDYLMQKIEYQKNKMRQERIKRKELAQVLQQESTEKLSFQQEEMNQSLVQEEMMRQQEQIQREKVILAETKKKAKLEKKQETEIKKMQKQLLKNELKEKRIKEKEEKRKAKEQKKQVQQEEARIQDELLEDNLYPKTKYNKNL